MISTKQPLSSTLAQNRSEGYPLIGIPAWLQFPLIAVMLAAASTAKAQEVHPATVLAERTNLPHGIAGDRWLVFVTEPLNGRVAVLDRSSGEEIGELPPPPGGFLLPFEMRVPTHGHLVLLDSGGFPSPASLAIPRVYDYHYHYNPKKQRFQARLRRTVSFEGIPFIFAEDVEVLRDGRYVVSDSGLGALWVIRRNGSITPGIAPRDPAPEHGLPGFAPCLFSAEAVLPDDVPYGLPGGFAPGVGSLASRDGWLYFGSTCSGGICRVPVSVFDDSRLPHERAVDIEVVSPRPQASDFDTLKGLTFNPWDPGDKGLYAADAFRMRIVRIDVGTGERTVIAEDPALFNFPVSIKFLPPHSKLQTLIISSDQEHRFGPLNAALDGAILFELPFLVTELHLSRSKRR